MGSGHSAHLHVDGDSVAHRLPAHVKLVALLAFVLAVVSVPERRRLVLGLLLALSGAVMLSTGVAPRHLAPRVLVAIPVVVFALVLPFVATGRGRGRSGRSRSAPPDSPPPGQCSPRGSAGVFGAVAFAVTTHPPDLVSRARSACAHPTLVVLVLSFMVRYLGVVTDELLPDAGRTRVPCLPGRGAARLAGSRGQLGRPVRPQLRTGRAGAPGDAEPRASRAGCRRHRRSSPRRPSGRRPWSPPSWPLTASVWVRLG